MQVGLRIEEAFKGECIGPWVLIRFIRDTLVMIGGQRRHDLVALRYAARQEVGTRSNVEKAKYICRAGPYLGSTPRQALKVICRQSVNDLIGFSCRQRVKMI